jgi:hypothetical protein
MASQPRRDTAPDRASSSLKDTASDKSSSPITNLGDLSERMQRTRVDKWQQPTVEDAPDEDEPGAWQIHRPSPARGMRARAPPGSEGLSVQSTRVDKGKQRAVVPGDDEMDTSPTSRPLTAIDVVSPPPPDTEDLSVQRTRVDKGKQRAVNPPGTDGQGRTDADRQRIDSYNFDEQSSPPPKLEYKKYYTLNSASMRKQKLDMLGIKFGGRVRAKSLVRSRFVRLGVKGD